MTGPLVPWRTLSATPAALAAVVLAAGCAALAPLPPTEADRRLGEEVARAVEAQIGLIEDAPLTAYLSEVGRRVAGGLVDSAFVYRFAILDQAEPNAFAAPGGHVFVSRGLLALARSEDELAGVLAHEIEHVERRHAARQIQRERRLGAIALPGRVVAGVLSEDLARLVGTPLELVAAGYDRAQEREADRLGQPLAEAAGYDPRALVGLLGRMDRVVALATGEKRAPTFFDSHPDTAERMAALARTAPSPTAPRRPGIAPDEAAFLARLDGLLLGADPDEGVVRGSTFLHPGLDLHVALPEGWRLVNTRRYVAAIAPGEQGLAVLGLLGTGVEADLPELARVLAARIEAKHAVKPTRSGPLRLGGNPAWSLVFTDESGAEPVHLYFAWMLYRGIVYQVIGVCRPDDLPRIRAAGESVRPLTAMERASISELRLRVVTARAGETLGALGLRTQNALPLAVVAALNDLDAGHVFAGDRPVKVGVRAPYRAAR